MLEKIGIGIDIVQISRFKKIPYTTKKNFYDKIFTKSEINYCLKFKDQYTHFAGKFALKEAVKKSIPTHVAFLDIITEHKKSKPNIKIKNVKNYIFLASLSHEKDYAIATVISEKTDD